MSFSHPVSRLTNYYRRHGLRASLDRGKVFAQQALTFGKMVVFYWDLTNEPSELANNKLGDHLAIERKSDLEQINIHDWNQIVNFWNRKVTEPAFSRRLRQGATIWLLRCEGKLAGYGWSVAGRSLESHYYPLGAEDAIVYDFLTFPEYRGRGFLPYLLNNVLKELKSQNIARAHFDVAAWNRASLLGTAKTAFPRHLLGIARKTEFLGRTFVEWFPLPKIEAERFQILSKMVAA